MDIEKLYQEYFSVVYKYILSISKDPLTAEEMTQETFFKALKKIDEFRGESSIKVWLCQIAKNTYYDYVKRQGRHEELPDEYGEPQGSVEQEFFIKSDARKAGISVSSIRGIINDELTLQDAARKSLDDLQSKMEELAGSIRLCDEIAHSDYTLDKMDADSIIDRIRIEESKGVRFLSVANELIDFEAKNLGIYIGENDDSIGKKLRTLVVYVLCIGVACGISWKLFKWGSFWENFTGVISTILALFVIFGIVFFIGRKNAKAGEIALKTLRIIAAVFLAFVIMFLIVILLNSRLHFLY